MSRPVPQEVCTAAQASQQRWGCPASVCIAQWADESGWGEHSSGKNNPFGIKATLLQAATVRTTREFVGGKWVTIKARFRDFESLDEAFDQHGKLLATGFAYADAREHIDDPRAYANALTGHYATDPHYGAKLIAIMDGGNFYRFDVAAREPTSVASQSSASVTIKPSPAAPRPTFWQWLAGLFGVARSKQTG